MFCLSRQTGLPEPKYVTYSDSVRLIFRYEAVHRQSDQPTDQPTDQAPTNNSAGSEQAIYQPTDQAPAHHVLTLLRLLINRELSSKQIMDSLDLIHRPTFRTNYLRPATYGGYVTSSHPDQPNHPELKYRLTEKGRNCSRQ